MRGAALLLAWTCGCAAPAPAASTPTSPSPAPAGAPAPSKKSDCHCSALCPRCGGAARDKELHAFAEAACPDWASVCACPTCDEDDGDPPQLPE